MTKVIQHLSSWINNRREHCAEGKSMTKAIQALVLAGSLIGANAHASLVVNESFSSCNPSEWQLDTDGFGTPFDTSDFTFTKSAGNCSATITMGNLYQDYLDFGMGFANTLYTTLDMSSLAPGEPALLSFNWEFAGFDMQDEWSDYFLVSLTNGAMETLFINDDYGSGTFSTLVDSSYDGWTIDFTLGSGFNFDSFTSSLAIENLSLVTQDIPEPATLALLLAGGIMIMRRKSTAK